MPPKEDDVGIGEWMQRKITRIKDGDQLGEKIKADTLSCVSKHMSEGGHRSPGSVNMVSWYSQQLSHHFAMWWKPC